MKRIAALLFLCAALLSWQAHACTVAGDTFTGAWWYEYRQTPASTPVPCGNATTPCLRTVVTGKGCNDLQSYGYIRGGITWFGNSGVGYSIGHGPWGWLYAYWLSPPQSGVFYWYTPTDGRWNRFVNCAPVGGSSDWTCTHQQASDGANYAGTAVVTLHWIFP